MWYASFDPFPCSTNCCIWERWFLLWSSLTTFYLPVLHARVRDRYFSVAASSSHQIRSIQVISLCSHPFPVVC
jgi:hypothetical protein